MLIQRLKAQTALARARSHCNQCGQVLGGYRDAPIGRHAASFHLGASNLLMRLRHWFIQPRQWLYGPLTCYVGVVCFNPMAV